MTETGGETAANADEEPTVLVVDDDEQLADTYALWLDDDFDVRVAYGGEEALQRVDSEVDAVLLDRRMSELSGEEVLQCLEELGYDCHVSMLTAVDPDTDVIEMPFDEYLTKPVTREELVETIEELLMRATLSAELQEYTALSSVLGALEAEYGVDPLEEPEELNALRARVEQKRAEVENTLDDLDDFEACFREVT